MQKIKLIDLNTYNRPFNEIVFWTYPTLSNNVLFGVNQVQKARKYSAITLISLEAWNVMTKFCKGSFLNDVSSEGEGGGPP